jgi:hypothetical protein
VGRRREEALAAQEAEGAEYRRKRQEAVDAADREARNQVSAREAK